MDPRPAAPVNLVAQIALGDVVRVRASTEAAQAHGLWSTLIPLARAMRVLPALSEAVKIRRTPLCDSDRELLRAHVRETAMQSTLVAHRATELLSELRGQGIDAVAFKGIALIAGLYGNPSRRMVADVDVLVPERDLEAACDTLRRSGMMPQFDTPIGEYSDYLRTHPRIENRSLAFRDPDGMEVDLHWRLGETSQTSAFTDSLIARSGDLLLMGKPVRIPCPVDAILLTVHHIVKSDLVITGLVKDLRDLLSWWILRPDAWSPDEVLARARDLGIEPAVAASWSVLAHFNSHPSLAEAAAEAHARMPKDQQKLARGISELITHGIAKGGVNQDLAAIYQRGALRRWFASRLLHRSKRRNLDESSQSRTVGSAQRFFRLVRAAITQHRFERTGFRALAELRQQVMGGGAERSHRD